MLFRFGTLFAAPTPVRVVGLTFALFAAVICFRDMGRGGAHLRLDIGQLLDQFLGISWHNIVQTIVFVLNLDGHIPHQETAHREQGYRNVPAFDFRWAVNLIIETQ